MKTQPMHCPECGADFRQKPPSNGLHPYCMACGADLGFFREGDRMNKDAITIEGRWDAGAWDRAIMVARDLQRAGLWDGAQPLTIVDAYAVHGRLFGIEHLPAADLAAGQDYRIGATE